jgi:hypothetical protein
VEIFEYITVSFIFTLGTPKLMINSGLR